MIAETSLQVYNQEIRPNLTKKQEEVFKAALNASDWTGADLAAYMGRAYSSISGRILELVRAGKLEHVVLEGKIVTRYPKVGGERGRVFRVARSIEQTNLGI